MKNNRSFLVNYCLKKMILISAFLSSVSINVFAQVPNMQWQKCIGGSGCEEALSIQLMDQGGYVIAGRTSSFDGDATNQHGGIDAWVMQLSETGMLDWQKCFGGTARDDAYEAYQTADGGLIFAGYSYSNDGDVTDNHGNGDFWVVKLDSTKSIEWQKCLGGTSTDEAYAMNLTDDGGYIVVGTTGSSNWDVSVNHGGFDYWVVKLAGNGLMEWQKSYGGSGTDFARAVQQTEDGGYIIAGQSSSTNGDVSGNHGSNDCWIVKVDSVGTIQWQKSYGGTAWDGAYSISKTVHGGFIVAGHTYSYDGDVSGNHGSSDYWILKIDENGTLEWQKCFGGSDFEVALSIKQTNDEGYIITGQTKSTDGDIVNQSGSDDFWTVKIDQQGTMQWQKSSGGGAKDNANAIQQTSDNGYVLVGQTLSVNGDVSNNHGNCDFWIVKLDCPVSNSQLNVTSCGSYLAADGQLFHTSGTYTITLPNAMGCDSLVTYVLTVVQVDTTISLAEPLIISNAVGAAYQWLDCEDNMSPISGATEQHFTVSQTGSYAVAITQEGCTDTSACTSITIQGVNPQFPDSPVLLYPNPTQGLFYLDFGQTCPNATVIITDSQGREILQETFINQQLIELKTDALNGLLLVYVFMENKTNPVFCLLKK